MTEGELIAEIIEAKEGDREFLLSYLHVDGEPNDWFAAIGNRVGHVGLGELSTNEMDFYAEADTAKEALEKLLAAVRGAK